MQQLAADYQGNELAAQQPPSHPIPAPRGAAGTPRPHGRTGTGLGPAAPRGGDGWGGAAGTAPLSEAGRPPPPRPSLPFPTTPCSLLEANFVN